jgi:hypothetical protein
MVQRPQNSASHILTTLDIHVSLKKPVRLDATCGVPSVCKVEQFVITAPEESWNAFDIMLGNSEAHVRIAQITVSSIYVVSCAVDSTALQRAGD